MPAWGTSRDRPDRRRSVIIGSYLRRLSNIAATGRDKAHACPNRVSRSTSQSSDQHTDRFARTQPGGYFTCDYFKCPDAQGETSHRGNVVNACAPVNSAHQPGWIRRRPVMMHTCCVRALPPSILTPHGLSSGKGTSLALARAHTMLGTISGPRSLSAPLLSARPRIRGNPLARTRA